MPYDGVPVIQIEAGREGQWGLRNRNAIPLGGLITLRNATLEDHTWRMGGGAVKLGDAIGTLTIQAAIDFWVNATTQRTLVALSDGSLRKDNGSGASWASLASGLTTSGQVSHWTLGGQESAGRARKAFHCDRVNAVRVLSGDGASMTTLANPPADWSGANQPGFSLVARGALWAGGNANAPHRLYRSLVADHEDFLTFPYNLEIAGPGERLVAGLPYKGGILLWKYPEGVYFVDLADPSDQAWRYYQVGQAGCRGPCNAALVEDDVIWIDPNGGWHAISATQATGSVRASDLSMRKLGSWFRDTVNRDEFATAQLVYYANKQEVPFACAGQGQTAKNRRVVLDVGRPEQGARWHYWDRDRNECLFLRKVAGVQRLAMGDAVGQLWMLDDATRSADGAGYSFEWFLKDTDFSEVVPEWSGRKKNLRFLQLEYDPRGTSTHQVSVYADGVLRQTIAFTLDPRGAVLPVTLPFVLGMETLVATPRRRLRGHGTRIALQGLSSAPNQDVSIARVLIGLEAAE